MKLDWNFIDNFLRAEADSDDVSSDCKNEIEMFLQTHDFGAFSDENAEQLAGIWDLAYRNEYEARTGAKSPNIFRTLIVSDEEVSNG